MCSEETLFYLENKRIAELKNFFTHFLQNRCSYGIRKKISKSVVKIGGFLQCWVHIFLRHDGCFWKINLRILWINIMKNFQVKYGRCQSIISPKTFSFESSEELLDLCLVDSRICTFGRSWNLSIILSYGSMPCSAYF